MKVGITFRPDLYGKPRKCWFKCWHLHFLFYRVDDKGNLDYITSRSVPWLDAVTPDQYHNWSNQRIVLRIGWVK